MRRHPLVVALLVFASTCSKSIDARAARDVTMHYDVYYLAMPVVAVDVDARRDAGSYRTTVVLRSAGILRAFASWESHVEADGTIDGATVRPVSYRADNAYRERRQRIDLAYERDGAVRGAVAGTLTDDARDDVPMALREGTLDPVSASAALAERLATTGSCAGTVAVFDGLRRYDLRYTDLGPATMEPSRHEPYRGAARLCRATVEPIAGFLPAGEHATEISTWLAPPAEGARPVAVRMDLTGPHGTLHVHLASVGTATP